MCLQFQSLLRPQYEPCTVKVNGQNFLTSRDLNLTSLTGYSRLSFQAVQMPYITSKYGHAGALLKGLFERIAMACLNYFYHCDLLQDIYQGSIILAIQKCKSRIIWRSKCLTGRDFLTGYITSQYFATGYISLTFMTGLTLTAANSDAKQDVG